MMIALFVRNFFICIYSWMGMKIGMSSPHKNKPLFPQTGVLTLTHRASKSTSVYSSEPKPRSAA